jgi:uncharacterized protein YceK
MKLFLTVVVVCLSGCSSIADYYDSQDPCQRKPYPDFCGSYEEPMPVIIQEGNWILY